MKKYTKVEQILKDHPETRYNDKALYIQYAKIYNKVYKEANDEGKELLNKFIMSFSELSLTRKRAYIQNVLKEYLPSKEILEKRKIKYAKCKKEYKKDTKGLFDGLTRWFNKF